MVPALVTLTLILCVLAGALIGARLLRKPARSLSLSTGNAESVEGFELHGGLRYHESHIFVGQIARNRYRIGLDDFIRRLVGPPDRIELPPPGRELISGKPALLLVRAHQKIRLPSPLTGTVMRVNQAVLDQPALAARDPLGEGWLMEIRPESSREIRELLRGAAARDWLVTAVNRMRAILPWSHGVALPDGGIPVDDYKDVMDDDAWEWLIRWTLLSDPSDDSGRES